jgi:hypothetical protein
MSVHLAKMLGKSQAEVAEFVQKMESKAGYPSHDIRLHEEISKSARNKTASLGLDPEDTIAQELYHSLQAKYHTDARAIDKALGVDASTSFDDKLIKAVDLASHVIGSQEVWSLKSTVAKSLLVANPPKKVMKKLHYRSVDSMLKHENVGKLSILAHNFESKSWQNSFAKSASHLNTNDCVLAPINFVHLASDICSSVSQPPQMSISDKPTGSIGLWPVKNASDVPLISMILSLLQGAQELGIKADQTAVAKLNPALHWWSNANHHFSTHPEGAVSFNINDVAHNHMNNNDHAGSATHHGAKALWEELSLRYQELSDEVEEVAQDEFSKLMPMQLAAELQEA